MNLIEFPVSELRHALAGLGRIVNRSTTLPVLKHLRVTREPAGTVTLQATDLDLAATYRAEVSQPGPVCDVLVPLEPLAKAARTAASNSRIAFLKEDASLTLRTYVSDSPVDQKLDTLGVEEWPPVQRCDLPPVILNQDLRSAVGSALQCSGQDSTRAALQGAWIDPSDPKAHYVMATDGRHLFTANSFAVAFKEPVLLPNQKFVQWSGFLDDGDWKVSILPSPKDKEPGWLQVQSDHWTFLSRKQADLCPNWRQAVPSPTEAKSFVRFSEAALTFLKRLLPTLPGTDAFDRAVTLDLHDQILTVKARARNQSDWTRANVPDTRVSGKPVSIRLNRDYLLRAVQFGLVNLDLYDELSPAVFHHAGQRLVIMPIRSDPGPSSDNQSPPPPEAAAPAHPSATQPQPTTEDNKTMVTPTSPPNTPAPASERGSLKPKPEDAAHGTALKAAIEQIEALRGRLRDLAAELTQAVDLIKAAEREKKASEKEVESVRATLRSLQRVQI